MAYFSPYNSIITLVWSSEALFKSFQQRSGQGQVKKVQIFRFINMDKKMSILTSLGPEI